MIEVVMERFAALMRAPTQEELALAAGVDAQAVPAALQALHAEGLLVLRDGQIVAAPPFSAVPADHVAIVNGRRHFGTDALGAFGVVAALGGIGRVERGELRAECAIRRVSAPRDYVVHFSSPPPRADSRLYATGDDATDEGGATLTVDACWRLARAWYGDATRPGYRARNREEAQVTFSSLGLTGEFWQVSS